VVWWEDAATRPAPLARLDVLWELAARHRVTVFGTSPQYLLGMAKYGIDPSGHDLSSIRVVGCTGSALPASAYPWVRDHVGHHALLAPNMPIWAGELSAPHLGVALAAYDAGGRPVTGEVGELVLTRPMPSMPLYFWNDPDGTRCRDAYFSSSHVVLGDRRYAPEHRHDAAEEHDDGGEHQPTAGVRACSGAVVTHVGRHDRFLPALGPAYRAGRSVRWVGYLQSDPPRPPPHVGDLQPT
jgi:hypothetical protein